MLKVLNITKPNSIEDLYDIQFKFNKGDYKSMACQTLMAFDIETSNGWAQPNGEVIGFSHEKYNTDEEYKKMIDEGTPVSLLYVWQIAIESQDGPKVFMGRTWDDYLVFINRLTTEIRRQAVCGFESIDRDAENFYALSTKNAVSCKIYVHNLGFEFQHLRNVWEEELTAYTRSSKQGRVFARSMRKPMKCSFNYNHVLVEHRDSLSLTQKSLDAWCKDEKLPVQKLKEPDDYYLEVRTPETELTDEEIQYSINDVVSMLYGLEKYREKYVNLADIPLTQTGAVRAKCRERVCMQNPEWAEQCAEITRSYTFKQFLDLCNLFQGGWTHGNRMYIEKTLHDVRCFDFASSYPAVMCTRTFPNGKFEECDVNEFDELVAQDINNPKYRWYAKIKIGTMVSKLDNTYWSVSKVCVEDKKPCIENQVVDNGRIYFAQNVTILCTDLDWDTFQKAYSTEDITVLELYKSEAGYLCKEIIQTILEYFAYKTSLKGDSEKESLYGESKQFINSIYGCAVTKIVSDVVTFTKKGWTSQDCNDEMFYETVQAAKAETTFLAYQHGIWITSWARHNLWDFILQFDEKIAYCDTDSIKGLFTDDDIDWINGYNNGIATLEDNIADKLGFDRTMYTPKTLKGKVKRLGIMEREEDCSEFRTLGAKRYVDLVEGEIQCTIAGLPKKAGCDKIKHVDEFNNNMVWDTKESKKNIAKYNDNQPACTWTDRDGHRHYSDDKFGICIQPTTFDLSMSSEFELFLKTLRAGKIDRNNDYFTKNPKCLYE